MFIFYLQLFMPCHMLEEVTAVRVECHVSAVRDGVVQTVVELSVPKTATQSEATAMSRESVAAITTGMALIVTSTCAIQTAVWWEGPV